MNRIVPVPLSRIKNTNGRSARKTGLGAKALFFAHLAEDRVEGPGVQPLLQSCETGSLGREKKHHREPPADVGQLQRLIPVPETGRTSWPDVG
jgi:hypothetical protein